MYPDRHVLRRRRAEGRVDDIDFFQFPIIDPAVPVAEEAPTDGYFASAKNAKDPDGAQEVADLPGHRRGTGDVHQTRRVRRLPTYPDGKSADTPLVKKGTGF